MLYSVRMRAAQGGAHDKGGKHISGAERLVSHGALMSTATAMLERALSHSRGEADFINLTVEAVPAEVVRNAVCLPIKSINVTSVTAGRAAAQAELIQAGVTPEAAAAGIDTLAGLANSLTGAMLVDARTGVRLDASNGRGIRVSRMDINDEQGYVRWLNHQGYNNIHIQEAVVLASKVMSAPGVVAELCWSDDPEYTAGYVATPVAYTRFTHLKPYGSDIGGRIFFIKDSIDLDQLTEYLKYQPVLISIQGEEARTDAVSN
ncbi:6-carboxyhexanoate--CoA ligase [Sporomusa malonica]|uniref:6-carboxyhexanoate--CoA ligase n=1 Tax=Sporomusa malonica TaxID=112901 RepID=A0A1W2C4E4_9FIRM|nr:6-carboxyhexanoate--CoA ligase [Sporomusa malonica]SMC80033.1 6-carboxyhexanoate--CoA ligase [Sporomusa malonica]